MLASHQRHRREPALRVCPQTWSAAPATRLAVSLKRLAACGTEHTCVVCGVSFGSRVWEELHGGDVPRRNSVNNARVECHETNVLRLAQRRQHSKQLENSVQHRGSPHSARLWQCVRVVCVFVFACVVGGGGGGALIPELVGCGGVFEARQGEL